LNMVIPIPCSLILKINKPKITSLAVTVNCHEESRYD
jgi:hypothetical protein